MTDPDNGAVSPRDKRTADVLTETAMMVFYSAIAYFILIPKPWNDSHHRWPSGHQLLINIPFALLGGAALWAFERYTRRRRARKTKGGPQ